MLAPMPLTAHALCLTSAGAFLLAGLVTGTWKYARIAATEREEARVSVYVDIAHRASLMYAFACGLMAQLVAESTWSGTWNLVAAAVPIAFFAAAVIGYVVHGVLNDTDNQLRRPHQLGRRTIAPWAVRAFMVALVLGEVGGVSVLLAGYLRG